MRLKFISLVRIISVLVFCFGTFNFAMAVSCQDLQGSCRSTCGSVEKIITGVAVDNCGGLACCVGSQTNSNGSTTRTATTAPTGTGSSIVSCETSVGGACRKACNADENVFTTVVTDCAPGYCCVTSGKTPPYTSPTTPGYKPTETPSQTNTASPQANSGSTTEFQNPLKVNTIQGFLANVLAALQKVVALVAVIMIVVGGIMYMFAGVDQDMMEKGKKTIGGAVIGLALIFAAPTFLKEILYILDGTDSSGLIGNAPSLKTIAERILNLLLSIVGILGIIGLIVGGGFYLTAYGDEERIKKGKDIITASIMGIIIASASLIVVQQIANLIK